MKKQTLCYLLIFLLAASFFTAMTLIQNPPYPIRHPLNSTNTLAEQLTKSDLQLVQSITPEEVQRQYIKKQTILAEQIEQYEENRDLYYAVQAILKEQQRKAKLTTEKQKETAYLQQQLTAQILLNEQKKQTLQEEQAFLQMQREQAYYAEQLAQQETQTLILIAQKLLLLQQQEAQRLALAKNEQEDPPHLARVEPMSKTVMPQNLLPPPSKENPTYQTTTVLTAKKEPIIESAPLPILQEEINPAVETFSLVMQNSLFETNDVVAFYGNPRSRAMGIIGQFSLTELEEKLTSYANEYDELNGERGVIPALHIIYGTCWPKGEIGYLSEKNLIEYIQFAAQRDWLVILDHQIGKYSVETAVKTLLPFLQYPNVHLALDPEWRTLLPMKEIGFVTGAEINAAQKMIEEYLIINNYKEKRFLVVHQFIEKMIKSRNTVRNTFTHVDIVHSADGFGSPRLKKETYARNAAAKNIPLKSFKLFSKPTIEKAGFDSPLMTPQQVLALNPRPVLIVLQ